MSRGDRRAELRAGVTAALAEGRPDVAWDSAAAAWERGSFAERHYAREVLGAVSARVPRGAWTQPRARVARRLDLPEPPAAQVGECSFPVVHGSAGRFVKVHVNLGDVDDVGHLPDETVVAVRNALTAVRRRVTGSFIVRFEAPDWAGSSCALAVALAAMSAAAGVPLDPAIAATGDLDERGGILPVGALVEKGRLRAAAWPAGRLLVPAGGPAEPSLVVVTDLAGAAAAAAIPAVSDIDACVQVFYGFDREGRWAEAATAALPLLDRPELGDEERLPLLVALLIDANHRGDHSAARAFAARAATEERPESEEMLARALASRSIAALDQMDVAAADNLLDEVPFHSAAARLHIDGTRALVRVAQGRFDAAVTLRRDNLGRAPRWERPRCLGDLADALRRAEAVDEAREALSTAWDEAHGARRPAYLWRTRAYLALHGARIERDAGRLDHARAWLDRAPDVPGPDPAIRLRVERLSLDDDVSQLTASLDATRSPILRLLVVRALARLGNEAGRAEMLSFPAFAGLDQSQIERRFPY